MSSTWLGPNVDDKLRSALENAALALAKARQGETGAPVVLSLNLKYMGLNKHKGHSKHRKGEYKNVMRMIDEPGPGPNASQRRLSKAPKALPAILRRAGTNIPQGWIKAGPTSLPEAQG
jgi:hypothetical protein